MIIQIYTYYVLEDALFIAEVGADHLGITVMGEEWENKVYLEDEAWRKVFELTTIDTARDIFRAVEGRVKRVFMPLSTSIDETLSMFKEAGGDILHLIYGFTLDELREIKERIRPKELILSVFFTSGGREENKEEFERALKVEDVVDYLLIDTKVGAWQGVTGRTHNWDISRELVQQYSKPVILAGGLSPENVMEAVEKVKPDGVDACTRLDSYPGKKDHEKVRRFVEVVRKWESST